MDDPFIGHSTGALRFDRLLGRGGMGSVYLGQQLKLNRQVAIKVIAPHLLSESKHLDRFTREAQTLGRLIHPNIIACHDFGAAVGPRGEPIHLMVLEYVDGWSLGNLARQQRLTVRQVLELHAQAAEGLAFAHGLGVVHRDVKPDNIMVTRQGQAKLADFGLARGADSVQVTVAGAIIGSPAYMSPEACRSEEPTPRSDLYSLGCSLFQLLTDCPPYNGSSTVKVLQQHVHDPVPSLMAHRPDLPRLHPVLQRLLAKEPGDRYGDGTALARLLRAEAGLTDPELVAGRIRRVAADATGTAPATVLSTTGLPPAPLPKTVDANGPLAVPLRHHRPSDEKSLSLRSMLGLLVVLILAGWGAMAVLGGPSAGSAAAAKLLVQARQQLDQQHPELVTETLGRIDQAALNAGQRTEYAKVKQQMVDALVAARQAKIAQDRHIQDDGVPDLRPTSIVLQPLEIHDGDYVTGFDLPDLSPFGDPARGFTGISRSHDHDGVHRLRLAAPEGATLLGGRVQLLLLSPEDAKIAVKAVQPGTTTALADFSGSNRWMPQSPSQVPSGTKEILLEANRPIYLAGAVLVAGREPSVSDLGLVPGLLDNLAKLKTAREQVAAKHQGRIRLDTLRLVVPLFPRLQRIRPEVEERTKVLEQAVAKELFGRDQMPKDQVIQVETKADKLKTLDTGNAEVLLVVLPREGSRKEINPWLRSRIDAGVLPIVCLIDLDLPKLTKALEGTTTPPDQIATGILDLGGTERFYNRFGLAWDPSTSEIRTLEADALRHALATLRELITR